MRPLLTYTGAKVWLVPWLNSLYLSTKAKRMNEIFCGGLSVSLGIEPAEAILNDRDPNVINFHRQVRDGLVLTRDISSKSKEEYQKDFYAALDRFNELVKDGKRKTAEAAEMFLIVNRKGFASKIRYTVGGELRSTPNYQAFKVYRKKSLSNYRDTMRRWKFTCKDFRKVRMRDGDFVYADPPYINIKPPNKTYLGDFDINDQEDVARLLGDYDGPSVISNYADEKIVEMYKDYGFTVEFIGKKRQLMRNYVHQRQAGLEDLPKYKTQETILVSKNIQNKPSLVSGALTTGRKDK